MKDGRSDRWPGVGPAVLASVALLSGLACGGASPEPDPVAKSAEARADELRTIVVVRSDIPGPIIIHALTGGLAVRLGTVSIGREARWPLPPLMVDRGRMVRLRARPVSDFRSVTTEAFAVGEGDLVYWRLTTPLQSSIASLRVRMHR